MTSRGHDVGAVADFQPGVVRRVHVNGRALALVRAGDDFFALRDVCAHQGARLSAGRLGGVARAPTVGGEVVYESAGRVLQCPWHGWSYDVTSGRSLFDPDRVRVRTYPVRVEGDRVVVDLD